MKISIIFLSASVWERSEYIIGRLELTNCMCTLDIVTAENNFWNEDKSSAEFITTIWNVSCLFCSHFCTYFLHLQRSQIDNNLITHTSMAELSAILQLFSIHCRIIRYSTIFRIDAHSVLMLLLLFALYYETLCSIYYILLLNPSSSIIICVKCSCFRLTIVRSTAQG